MTTYKEIVGQKITKVSSDPSEAKTGQMWYNSTDGKLRALGLVEAFSSASPIITAATKGAGFGPVGGPNIMFGATTPPATYIDTQIEYNGSGWASDGTYPQSLQGVGVTGVSTAAISVGGNNNGPPSFPSGVYNGPALEYNGSSWTAAPAYPVTSITQIANAGTETAAVFAGGYTYDPGSYTTVTTTNEYNGSSFSSSNAINTGRQTTVSAGTQTAAIMVGGDIWTSPSATATSNATEQYDGTSWTSVSNHPLSFSGNGFNSKSENTIINGAIPGGPDSTVFKYDGSSWSTIPGLATGRYQSASGTGSPTNVLCVSGRNPGWVTTVEEYNKSTNTITGAAWASGGALPTAVYDNAGAGTQTAGLSFGGDTAPDDKTTATFEYDGSSWTAGGALNTGRRELGGFGTQTAAVAACGGNYPASTLSEEYNGSSWTAGNPTSVARTMMGAAGVLTSGLVCGGNPGTITTTEEYDGTNWSSGGALPVGKQSNDAFGNTTNAIHNVGGNAATPTNYVNTSEAYDGTNWTSGPTMTYGADRVSATGSSTSGLVFSGRLGPSTVRTAATMYFNGTAFVSAPSLSAARSGGQASGKGETSNASSFVAGGGGPSRTNTTEEFTGETTAGNITDFTTS